MKKFLIPVLGLLFLLLSYPILAQDLFSSQEALPVRLKFSVKEMKKSTNDSTYSDQVLWYQDEEGNWDSLEVELRTRGNFRLDNCYYPPLRLKIKKKKREGTPFEEHKHLKVVLPCTKVKNANGFVAKEFLCYQLYQQVTPYSFQTRMIQVEMENLDDKKGEKEQLLGFLIEDDDNVADRFGGEIVKDVKIHPNFMLDTASLRHDFFQFLIGNTDFSSMFRHNEKILKVGKNAVLPLPYDFDMTGLVNPPYAQVSDLVDIEHVTDRLYRGYCRDPELMEYMRQEFLQKEDQIWQAVKNMSVHMDESDQKSCTRFIGDFFRIMKDDFQFQRMVMKACLTGTS
ncbi:hypothetical protein [Algoriphagus hitonicola]|uniref:CotH protein n=1 Tax=Algoriphagus hitonicola TaxID=435880 RepID=A0A1I2PBC2_9BACT|nr:hypothetical protein [Algoriphagus hitonicola]SFG10771.1 hypothetical protein SAMN04487988_101435 [Algoriphagus hitonicola]